MDPDEALKNARAAAAAFARNEFPEDKLVNLDDLACAFTALDQWLSGGGFLPKDWQQKR